MPAHQRKGLRPLSLFLMGVCLSQAAVAQVAPPWRQDAVAMRDAGDWSEFAKPAAATAAERAVDDDERRRLLTFVVIGIFIVLAVWVVSLIFMIMAALKNKDGLGYRYPVCIRFIK